MSQSKISRIETGLYKRTPRKEVEIILKALQASDSNQAEILHQLNAERTPLGSFVLMADTEKAAQYQRLIRRHIRTAKHIRYYSSGIIHGLLQTPEYMRAIFNVVCAKPGDHAAALRQRLLSQDYLWDQERTFTFVLSHATLYSAPAGSQAQLIQLGHLEQMARLPNINLMIIPLEAGAHLPGFLSVNITDEKAAIIEIGAQTHFITNHEEVLNYKNLLSHLQSFAVSGEDALLFIRQAQDFFQAKLQ